MGGAWTKGAGLRNGTGPESQKPGADRRGQLSQGRALGRGRQALLTRFCTVSSGAAGSRVRRRRPSAGEGGGEDWPLRASFRA